MKNENNSTKVITGVCRFSYLYALNPHTVEDGQTPRYSVSIIIPKSDTATIAKIKAAILAAYEDGESKLTGKGKKCPKLETLKLPLRDGDEERPEDEIYKDSYFINASNIHKPGIVDKFCKPITDENEIYSGMYGRASVVFYAFNKAGNKGIACGLNNLMKTADGERLSGIVSAETDFAEFAETEPETETNIDPVSGEILSDGETPF